MPAVTRVSPQASRIIRSSAIRVPPIAAVAGSRTSVGNAKLTAQSHAGAGSVPRSGDIARPATGKSQILIRPQSPITASSVAYTVRGDLERRIGRSRTNAPSASPPKNPATAPKTAIISVPSAMLNWRVHTISYPRPAKPDIATIGISAQTKLIRSRSRAHDGLSNGAFDVNPLPDAIARLFGSDCIAVFLCSKTPVASAAGTLFDVCMDPAVQARDQRCVSLGIYEILETCGGFPIRSARESVRRNRI